MSDVESERVIKNRTYFLLVFRKFFHRSDVKPCEAEGCHVSPIASLAAAEPLNLVQHRNGETRHTGIH